MSSGDSPSLGITPMKGTPLKSAFLTPCRRMGLKRRPTPSSTTPSPLVSNVSKNSSESPLSKRSQVDSPSADLDSTPKRKINPKRKSLVVTRVERTHTDSVDDSKNINMRPLPSNGSIIGNLEASIAIKREQLALLQKGAHPLQMETDRLERLIAMWRSGCQKAIEDLLERSHKNSEAAAQMLSLSVLISNLDIPPELVHFDTTKEEFY